MSRTDNADNPTVRTRGEKIGTQPDFHRTAELPDGTPVGKLGALWYVIDDDGTVLSRGYHEIRPTGSNSLLNKTIGRGESDSNSYIGKIGARREQFGV